MSLETVRSVAAIGLLVVMLGGLVAVIAHRLITKMGFGHRFIQTIVVIEIIPGIFLLGVLGITQGETTAALVGAAMGYAFGLRSSREGASRPPNS